MAITMRDKREFYFFRETLSTVLRGLVEKYTVIDLRNEASVYGKIKHVTGYMDVELEKCVFKNPRGDFFPFEHFYVKSRNIRYVHIPEGYSSQQLIEVGLQERKPKPNKPSTKKVYKKKRAENYQTEILKHLQMQHKKQANPQ